MSKQTAHHPKKHAKRPTATRPDLPDGAVYIGVAMIGVFAIALWYLVSRETWKHGIIGYLIAVAFLLNLYTWRACAGRPLIRWQRSLAKLPLRWVGYGTRGGKPLDAAHGSPRARAMLFVSIATCAAIIALVTWLLIPIPT
ncbi:MAG: hypothetical protein ACYS0D_14915 [Planctomycetota bacterium]